jgi:hypothetical protein
MTVDRTALDEAIDELYRAFADRPLRTWTEPCLDCCATVEEEARLHDAPLRELPIEAIEPYSQNAMTTWGDERELNHLLPRLMEVTTVSDQLWMCIETMGTAMHRARHTWTADEQAAVDRALLELWRREVEGAGHLYETGDLLCAIGWVTDDLTPHLAHWESCSTTIAGPRLARLIRLDWDPQAAELASAFWTVRADDPRPRQAQMDQIARWLMGPAPRDLLQAAATEQSAEAARALAALAGDPDAFGGSQPPPERSRPAYAPPPCPPRRLPS